MRGQKGELASSRKLGPFFIQVRVERGPQAEHGVPVTMDTGPLVAVTGPHVQHPTELRPGRQYGAEVVGPPPDTAQLLLEYCKQTHRQC